MLMATSSETDTYDHQRRLAYERSARPREYFAALRAAGPVENAENPAEPMLIRRADVE